MARKTYPPMLVLDQNGQPIPQSGPGTELKKLLAGLALMPKGCKCMEHAVQMDRWGVEGCKAHRAEIIGWLNEEKKGRTWVEKAFAAARAIASGVAFRLDPSDPAGSLLDEAIRRAEAKEKT